jgi:hypothetical protein
MAPHSLSDFSHYIHDGETGAVIPGAPVNIFAVLDTVVAVLG